MAGGPTNASDNERFCWQPLLRHSVFVLPSRSSYQKFIQHLPEYPAACCGDEWLNIAFLRGAIPRQEGAGFIFLIWTAFWVYYHIFPSIPSNIREGLVSNRLFRSGPCRAASDKPTPPRLCRHSPRGRKRAAQGKRGGLG